MSTLIFQKQILRLKPLRLILMLEEALGLEVVLMWMLIFLRPTLMLEVMLT